MNVKDSAHRMTTRGSLVAAWMRRSGTLEGHPRHILTMGLIGILILLGYAALARAGAGTRYATGITAPGGSVWMGSHLWVADHAQGFARLDLSADGVTYTINPFTASPSVGGPGQPVFDPATGFIYVGDNSRQTQGVWRLTFDPASETVVDEVLLAPSAGLAGNRPVGLALGPDGNLYASFLKNGSIVRITNPAGQTQTVQSVGSSSDGRRVLALTFLGNDLYLAETAAITRIVNATSALCTGGCKAKLVRGTEAITAPGGIATDGTFLFIADTVNPYVYRFTISTGTLDFYSTTGMVNGVGVPYEFISSLGFDPAGNLYVGDDPTEGGFILQGRIFAVAPGPIEPPPPPPAALTTGNLFASGVTAPAGRAWMGSHLWVADHAQGFCRLDLSADGVTYAINPFTASLAAVSPGQPTFDTANNFVYVPDNSAQSQGVWRLTFDPASETIVDEVLLAPTAGLGGNRPIGSALGSDGNLYISFLKNGNIVRITNPAGASQTVQSVGGSTDGRRVLGLAFVGNDLYLAETGTVSKIANAISATCTGGCKAKAVNIPKVAAPAALAFDGTNLFIADIYVYRYNVSTGASVLYAAGGSTPTGASLAFQGTSGLGLDPSGNLYVGDDPTEGAMILQGHIWSVVAVP